MALAVQLQIYVWTCLLSCKGQARTRNPRVARPVQSDWQASKSGPLPTRMWWDNDEVLSCTPQAAVQRYWLLHLLNYPSSSIMRKTSVHVFTPLFRILEGLFYANTQHNTGQWEIPESRKMILLDSSSSMPRRSRTVRRNLPRKAERCTGRFVGHSTCRTALYWFITPRDCRWWRRNWILTDGQYCFWYAFAFLNFCQDTRVPMSYSIVHYTVKNCMIIPVGYHTSSALWLGTVGLTTRKTREVRRAMLAWPFSVGNRLAVTFEEKYEIIINRTRTWQTNPISSPTGSTRQVLALDGRTGTSPTISRAALYENIAPIRENHMPSCKHPEDTLKTNKREKCVIINFIDGRRKNDNILFLFQKYVPTAVRPVGEIYSYIELHRFAKQQQRICWRHVSIRGAWPGNKYSSKLIFSN